MRKDNEYSIVEGLLEEEFFKEENSIFKIKE